MNLEEFVKKLGLTINPKLHVVVLTGAGISAESGVPIFRGKGSMWENPEARKLKEYNFLIPPEV